MLTLFTKQHVYNQNTKPTNTGVIKFYHIPRPHRLIILNLGINKLVDILGGVSNRDSATKFSLKPEQLATTRKIIDLFGC